MRIVQRRFGLFFVRRVSFVVLLFMSRLENVSLLGLSPALLLLRRVVLLLPLSVHQMSRYVLRRMQALEPRNVLTMRSRLVQEMLLSL